MGQLGLLDMKPIEPKKRYKPTKPALFTLYSLPYFLYPFSALMPSPILHEQAKNYKTKHPDLMPGYTVRVHERIREGEKERVQIFEGLVIAIHKGHVPTDATFTVRRIASGIGVEKIFPFNSPLLEKIEVKKIAKVRRAKLSFLRGRKGKSARLSERFTKGEEFAVAVQAPVEAQAAPVAESALEVKEEAPATEKKE